MMIKATLLFVTLFVAVGTHATDLTRKLNFLIRSTDAATELSPAGRGQVLANTALRMLGAAQAGQAEDLRIDESDATTWLEAVDRFGPVIIGGRIGRQAEVEDKEFIATLDDFERRSWNDLDESLSDEQREGLRRVFPVLAAAVYEARPSVRATMILGHLGANNMNVVKTAAAFGKAATVFGLGLITLRTRLPKVFKSNLGQDVLYAQTLIALARYLKVPEQSGFCQNELK